VFGWRDFVPVASLDLFVLVVTVFVVMIVVVVVVAYVRSHISCDRAGDIKYSDKRRRVIVGEQPSIPFVLAHLLIASVNVLLVHFAHQSRTVNLRKSYKRFCEMREEQVLISRVLLDPHLGFSVLKQTMVGLALEEP